MDSAKCILLVDDDRDMRELVRELLIEDGYMVVTAANGFAALKVLKTFHVDLLLSDLQMPDMDGIDLIRRARNANPMLVGVLLTAALTDDPDAMMRRAGASAFLVKPADLEHLGTIIGQALETEHASRDGPHAAPAG
jgi:two-component system, NtrC family, response regulator HydG